MRLRCLSIDYFEEASKASAKKHEHDQLPVPVLKDEFISLLPSAWTMHELLKTVSPVADFKSSTLGCLDIRVAQSRFLFAVLPVNLPKPYDPSQSASVIESLERVMEKSRLLQLHEFEVVELDTLTQQNVVMLELCSLANTRRNNQILDVDTLPSFNEIKESPHFLKVWGDLNHIGVSYSKSLKKSPRGSDIHLTPRENVTSRLPLLEVADVNETVLSAKTREFNLNVKGMMFDLLATVEHKQLGDFTPPPESHLMDLSSKMFTSAFYLYFNRRDKPTADVFQYQDETDSASVGQATRIKRNLLVFELPVCFIETDNIAHCSFKQLLREINPPQQTLIPIKHLDFTSSDQYETLVVVPELVLSDSTFSSLPVPTFKEKDRYCIAANVMHEVLLTCKHYVPCALNFLYLDWHFSHGTDCGKNTCCKLENSIGEIGTYEYVQYVMRVVENAPNSILNRIEKNLEIKHSNEIEPLVCSPKHSFSLESRESACSVVMADQPELSDKGREIETNLEVAPHCLGSSTLPPSAGQSNPGGIFACDDLALFIQARQGVLNTPTRGNSVKKVPDLCGTPKEGSLEQRKRKSCDASEETKENNLNVHHVLLSESIIKLREMLELDYKRIINDDHDLAFHIKDHSDLEKLNTEKDAKHLLIMLIEQKISKQEKPQDQKLLRGLISLYILQQTAENLCMYGVQVGHLYMESWYMSLQFLQDLICFSYAELEEAYKQVEKGLLLDHPKLKYLVNIIESHKVQVVSPKFLLIAERRALFTLYKQIMSCNLKPYQFDREGNLIQDEALLNNSEVLENAVVDALSKCDCLMVPPEYITLVFPVKQFTCILQYGDFSASLQCKINTSDAEVHCLQVVASKSYGASNRLATQETFCKDRASGSGEYTIKHSNNNSRDTELSCESHNKPKTQHKQLPAVSSPVTSKLIGRQQHTHKQCKMNIVVNISLSYNHLLYSRRSSYQKIIALENDGFFVVERDLVLPIDLILTPSTCIILYTKEKLFEDSVILDTQGHLAWVQDIANNVMKPLSFSFNTCIMIFEGTFNFLQEALQAFGNLYASAVVLDIQLQCFISSGPLVTDTIITKCICSVKSVTTDISFPAMREAKTYVESFLNMFASINPLTAHAILSCGGGLKHFLCLEIEEQLKLTESFGLSENSLNLFKLQVHNGSLRYGLKQGKGKISKRQNNAREKDSIEAKDFHFPPSGLDIDEDIPVPKKRRVYKDIHTNITEQDRKTRNEFSGYHHQSENPAIVRNSQDAKLRRTMDLMLKRNREKETGYSLSQSRIMDYISSQQIDFTSSSQEERCYFPESCEFKQNMEPEHTSSVKPTIHNPNFNSPVHVDNQWVSSKTDDRHENNFNSPVHVDNPSGVPFSPKSTYTVEWDILGNNKSDDLNENLLCQTGENIDSLFEWNVADDFSKTNEKDFSVDFMNGTTAHLKRKLNFEYPDTEKHFTKKTREWQAQRKLNLFDSYKFKKLESERLNAYGVERNRCTQDHVKNGGRPSIYCRKRVTASTISPPQSRKLQTSWTPVDKRSKKVLSFARKGNDNQSRLVWAG